MTGEFTLPIIINAVITFTITVVPLIIANSTSIESRQQYVNIAVRHILFPGITANLFFLFLFSLYRQQSIAGSFLHLCEKINVKFMVVALFIDLLIIGVLRYGTGSVRICKMHAPKPIFAMCFISLFLISGASVFREAYGIVPVEQLIFHIKMPNTGANFSMVRNIITKIIADSIIRFVLLLSLLSVEVKFKCKYFHITSSRKCQWIVAMLFFVFGVCFFTVNMDIPSYILSLQKGPSTFYEENYIDPNGVEITFPGKKRNLIVIFVESLETGFLIRNNGGAFSERLMPEIEDLMRDNINFSMDSGLGGAHELYGTEWTIAGIVSQYSGVPMAVSFLNQIDWNNYGMLGDDFLPGASGVGDILHKAGYKNYFILGSDIEFGGRDKYFKTHKDTIIYDYNYFIENNYIPKDYNVWWGFEDRKLYAFSKEKLLEIAQDAPFFATILTADTHPVGGYLDAGALKIFDSQYMDVVFDTSRQLSDFLEWLKEQEFYENTTVAVLGDHLHHDSSVFPRDYQIHSLSSKYDSSYRGGLDNKYKRFPVNIFINSLLSEEHTKNRIFSHFDVFPALIDSVGGVYNAKGLALGRSMNKGEATLLEELELDYVNDVLQRRSNYYDRLWQKKTE